MWLPHFFICYNLVVLSGVNVLRVDYLQSNHEGFPYGKYILGFSPAKGTPVSNGVNVEWKRLVGSGEHGVMLVLLSA